MTERGYLPPEARGQFGKWLLDAMGNKSFEQLAKDMADRGHVHTAAYYRGMASGSKKPGRVIRAALEDYFKSAPAQTAAQPPADQAALIEAMNRQTAQLKRIADALRQMLGLPPDEDEDDSGAAAHTAGWEVGRQLRRALPTETPPPESGRARGAGARRR